VRRFLESGAQQLAGFGFVWFGRDPLDIFGELGIIKLSRIDPLLQAVICLANCSDPARLAQS
jgi:hypothetical protein